REPTGRGRRPGGRPPAADPGSPAAPRACGGTPGPRPRGGRPRPARRGPARRRGTGRRGDRFPTRARARPGGWGAGGGGAGWGGSRLTPRLSGEGALEAPPGPEDVAHRGVGRDVERRADLLVAQPLHAAEQEADPGDVAEVGHRPQEGGV